MKRYQTKTAYRYMDDDGDTIFTYRKKEAEKVAGCSYLQVTELSDRLDDIVVADFYDDELAKWVAEALNKQDRIEQAAFRAGGLIIGAMK